MDYQHIVLSRLLHLFSPSSLSKEMASNHAYGRTNYPVDPSNIMVFCQTPMLHAAVEHSLKFDPLDLVQHNPTAL